MLAFDTNLAVYAANTAMAQHRPARRFLEGLAGRDDVVVCELMLVELYLKLRNKAIFPHPMSAARAAAECHAYRNNRLWTLVESAPVMAEVWRLAAAPGFAMRRILDVRLALTLRRHGVSELATANVRDFQGLGFDRVFDPLAPIPA